MPSSAGWPSRTATRANSSTASGTASAIQAGAHSGSSHFTDVGSGRYDFWRVALDAFVAHPIGGLGQDNFDDYYVPRRRTDEEPSCTHSIELRLLAHTGLVGFALFATFLIAAIAAAMPRAAPWRARGSSSPAPRCCRLSSG